ncbi:MAG TPA: RNA polymerase sigma factor, partial [Cytophagaceae bacterium]
AFLYITTRNTCLNYLRKNQVRKQAGQELPKMESEDPRPTIALAETYRDAYQLIKTLRKKQRQVIEMMLEGYSTAEIALKLQQQESNIRKIKFRALNEIREKLKKIS